MASDVPSLKLVAIHIQAPEVQHDHCVNTNARALLVTKPFRLPDPPRRHPDDMTSFDHLAATGNVKNLALHLGNPETTLVAGERYVTVKPTPAHGRQLLPRLAHRLQRQPDNLPGKQRLHH